LERAAAAAGLGARAGAGGDATIGYNHTELQRKTIYSRPASLDSMGLSDSDIISDEEFTWLSQLSLDSWDSPNFFIYPVLVLVARAAGPNDNWTKHCKSDKMFVGTTSDGWMDEHMKFEWYQHSKSFPHSPFGDANRRMIDQRDQHYSNESIRQSLQQEADGNIGIGTPGHHTAALQHMDQRGGPIQHANRYARALIRREHRARGEITIPAMLRIIEISVAASHTPKIFSYASRRVGWYEDENGKLAYNPMATCDKSVLTAYIPPALPNTNEAGTSGDSPVVQQTTLALPQQPGAYRKASEFLRKHSSAGQLAALTVRELFTSVVSESEDGSGDEGEGERRRKKGGGRKHQKGVIISKAEFRQGKQEIAQKKEDKKHKASSDECKEYDRVQGVLGAWAALTLKFPVLATEHTAEQALGALQTVATMKIYLEMKSKEKPKSQLKKEEAMEAVRGVALKEIALREGNVPDGYREWKEKEHERLQLGAAPAAAPLALAAPESPSRAGKRKAAAAIMNLAEASTPNTRAVLKAQAEVMLRGA